MNSDFQKYIGFLEEKIKNQLIKLYNNNTQVFKFIISDGGFPTEFLQDGQSIYVTVNEFISRCKGLSRRQLEQIFAKLYEENQGSEVLQQAFTSLVAYQAENSLPQPNAGLENNYFLTSKIAFSINRESSLSQWMPFEIGTIWGLRRQSFIGIVAGCGGDEIYENLVCVEQELFHTLENQPDINLPTRWWIKIDINRRIPQEKSQVWNAALERNNPLVEYLQTKGLPNGIIPGIFIEISEESILNKNQIYENLLKYCEAIINQVFVNNQVGIVINIKYFRENVDINQELILNLKNNILEKCSKINIQTLGLKKAYQHSCRCQQIEIKNLAASDDFLNRRQGLILARSPDDIIISDMLMDAWVEGGELKPESIPQAQDFDTYSNSFINELRWAVLRQFHQNPQKVTSVIEEKLNANLRNRYLPVCDFCLHKITAEIFVQQATDEQIELAIRAGREIEINLALTKFKFKTYELDRAIFAWILFGKLPDYDLITQLLRLNREQRAVFGLCNQEEWQQLNHEIIIHITEILCSI